MTTRKRMTKIINSDSSKEQHNTEVVMSSAPTQEELEKFFTDEEIPEELTYEPPAVKKRIKPPKTGKIFLSEEDIRHFEAYRKFLKDEQGIKKINHKPI
jgi:hypothetical protein